MQVTWYVHALLHPSFLHPLGNSNPKAIYDQNYWRSRSNAFMTEAIGGFRTIPLILLEVKFIIFTPGNYMPVVSCFVCMSVKVWVRAKRVEGKNVHQPNLNYTVLWPIFYSHFLNIWINIRIWYALLSPKWMLANRGMKYLIKWDGKHKKPKTKT